MESMGKKPRRRRSFTPEFKAEIAGSCQQDDRSVGQVAKESPAGVYTGSCAVGTERSRPRPGWVRFTTSWVAGLPRPDGGG